MMPSYEKKRLRKRMRSPEEYEKLRQSVQGPEKLAEQMDHNEDLAELSFALETEPQLKEELKKGVEKDLKGLGLENVLTNPESLSDDVKNALEAGQFDVSIDTNPDTQEDQMMITPEGNISEKLPIRFALSEKYAAQLGNSGTGEETVTYAIKINEELCGYLDLPASLDEEQIVSIVKTDADVVDCIGKRVVEGTDFSAGKEVNLRVSS